MFRSPCSIVLGALVVACSSATPGARPHDMSAAHHEATAGAHERGAEAHRRGYVPESRAASSRCDRSGTSRPPICWASIENPTAKHLRLAEDHRRSAAAHRAASQALRDAEVRACAGLADEDRDTSPFDRREDIAVVEPLHEQVGTPKLPRTKVVGAIVTFRAVPGLTTEWLQRVVDCHLARNAALGHVVPETPDCPLVPEGVTARVSSTGTGFAVAIRGSSETSAREVLERAQRLRAPTTPMNRRGAP